MNSYPGSHGEHLLAYKKHIERVVNDAVSEFLEQWHYVLMPIIPYFIEEIQFAVSNLEPERYPASVMR
jgi:leucyl-tRNA synthetase